MISSSTGKTTSKWLGKSLILKRNYDCEYLGMTGYSLLLPHCNGVAEDFKHMSFFWELLLHVYISVRVLDFDCILLS